MNTENKKGNRVEDFTLTEDNLRVLAKAYVEKEMLIDYCLYCRQGRCCTEEMKEDSSRELNRIRKIMGDSFLDDAVGEAASNLTMYVKNPILWEAFVQDYDAPRDEEGEIDALQLQMSMKFEPANKKSRPRSLSRTCARCGEQAGL